MSEEEIKYKVSNYCSNCNEVVETGVIYTYSYNEYFYDEFRNSGTGIILCKCLKCGEPVLLKEDFENIEDNTFTQNKIQLYPDGENQALINAPEIVVNPYREALKCYRA